MDELRVASVRAERMDATAKSGSPISQHAPHCFSCLHRAGSFDQKRRAWPSPKARGKRCRPFPRWVTRRCPSDLPLASAHCSPWTVPRQGRRRRPARPAVCARRQLDKHRDRRCRRQVPGHLLGHALRGQEPACGYWVARLSAGGLQLSPPPLPDRPSLPFTALSSRRRISRG